MTRLLPLRLLRAVLLATAGALALAGCATTAMAPSPADPFEPWNRAMYAIHEPIDTNVVRPAVQAYEDYVPSFIRLPIRNFFNNIEDLFSAINGFLQNKPEKAGQDLGRVVLNTGMGLGGLLDWATEAGIPRGNEDFGQTFGYWGIPQGPYFFVPLFGPTTLRDGTGIGLRAWIGPVGFIPDVPTRNIIYGIGAVDLRAQALEAQTLVGQAALDKYTFIRRAYLQRRQYLVYDGNVPPEKEDE